MRCLSHFDLWGAGLPAVVGNERSNWWIDPFNGLGAQGSVKRKPGIPKIKDHLRNSFPIPSSIRSLIQSLDKKSFMVPNSKDPYESIIKQHPTNNSFFSQDWSALHDFSTGRPPRHWQTYPRLCSNCRNDLGFQGFPVWPKVLIYSWVTISWYQDLPFQAIPCFIWRGNLGHQKEKTQQKASKVTTGFVFFFFLGGEWHSSWLVRKKLFLYDWSLKMCFSKDISPLWATRRWPTWLAEFVSTFFAASKLWRCCDFVVKSLDVDKIQAHLWNSVAGINVGMGYFFYFVGAKFCESVGMRKTWMPEVKVEEF